MLTEGAVRGIRWSLRGLMEIVLVGRLIPAGTGLAYHTQRRRNAAGLTEDDMALLSAETVQPDAPVEVPVEMVMIEADGIDAGNDQAEAE